MPKPLFKTTVIYYSSEDPHMSGDAARWLQWEVEEGSCGKAICESSKTEPIDSKDVPSDIVEALDND